MLIMLLIISDSVSRKSTKTLKAEILESLTLSPSSPTWTHQRSIVIEVRKTWLEIGQLRIEIKSELSAVNTSKYSDGDLFGKRTKQRKIFRRLLLKHYIQGLLTGHETGEKFRILSKKLKRLNKGFTSRFKFVTSTAVKSTQILAVHRGEVQLFLLVILGGHFKNGRVERK